MEPDLNSNNSNESFFLDISKLKRKFFFIQFLNAMINVYLYKFIIILCHYIMYILDGDNSVLKLLEKSIEPVDETSFVSSILNSGKVIQLTGMIHTLVLLWLNI